MTMGADIRKSKTEGIERRSMISKTRSGEFGRTVLYMAAILAASVLIGYLLLVLVFCIPQQRIINGLANSVPAIARDDLEDRIFGYPASRLDVFTDSAVLIVALCENDESPFKRAAACYLYVYNDLGGADRFMAYFEPREPDGITPYPRYWYGTLIFIKPLLVFFNYSDIRMINAVCQAMLVSFVVCAFAIRKLYRYIPAVFITYLFLMPFTLPMSLQYSPVFYIGFGSLAVLVMFYDKLNNKGRLIYLFLITGILTSYFDLLTYPVFTLGIPLTGMLITAGDMVRVGADIGKETGTVTGKYERIKEFIACGISWFIGYAGMWAGKIFVAMFFYGKDALTDALGAAGQRSLQGASEESITYFEALQANLSMYKNRLFGITLIVYTAAAIALAVYRLIRKRPLSEWKAVPLFLFVMAIPFVWYFVTTEHADLHSFMTYKNLTVAVFAYCSMLVYLSGRSGRTKDK